MPVGPLLEVPVPETIFGLPLHPLVVHATVVFVPLTAVVLALSMLSPRFRGWAGPLPLGLAVLSVILAPLSTSTGESLEHSVGETRLIEEHAELAGGLVWWCVAMLVVAAASYLVRRRNARLSRGASIALVVAGLVIPLGTVVQTALIGHSGAKAAWARVQAHPGTTARSSGGDD